VIPGTRSKSASWLARWVRPFACKRQDAVADGHDQGVVGQQAGLLADDGGRGHKLICDRQDLHAEPRDVRPDLPVPSQGLNFGGVTTEAADDAGVGPAVSLTGLDRHDPVSHVGQVMGGGHAAHLLAGDPFEELEARRPECRVGGEMIDENVGVDVDHDPRGDVGERHAPSPLRECGNQSSGVPYKSSSSRSRSRSS
jgi:hypothetical protein